MNTNARPGRRTRVTPVETNGVALLSIVRLATAIFALAFLFGGLPQSSEVRDRLARAGLVSSGRPDLASPTTTTTAPPPAIVPAELIDQLAAAGFPDVLVTELDRTVTLTGSVPDEASRQVVRRVVESVPGVDAVDDRTIIAAPGSAGDVIISATTNRVNLSGSVPDEVTAAAVLDAVQAVYVGDQIDGAVEVDPELAVPASISISLESTRPELAARLESAFDSVDATSAIVDFRFRQLEAPLIEQELATLLADAPIQFGVGSSRVDVDSAASIDAVAELLQQSPSVTLEVGGHTDDRGTDRANRQLSADRADAVVAELRDRGVANELVAVGYGATRPRTTPVDNDEARAANRRIEFLVITP